MQPYRNCSYVDSAWADKLTKANLGDFQALWEAKLPWVEEPNYRRGGWSGVARYQIDAQDETSVVYIKRQQNHVFRPWSNPKRGLPTFYREARNILYFNMHGVPAVTPVFFDMREQDGNQQAILVTKALIGYQSLEDLIPIWQRDGYPDDNTMKVIIDKIATALRKIHQLGYRHGAFKSKHIFIQYDEAKRSADVRLLDFEVSRRVRRKYRRVMPDFISVYFTHRMLPARYYYYFLQSYMQRDKVRSSDFRFVRNIRRFEARKIKKRRIKAILFRKKNKLHA